MSHAALNQVMYAKLLGYALLVVAPEQKRRATRNDTQLVKPRQARDDVLGNSITDISLLRIDTHIGEGENSNGRPASRWHLRLVCCRGFRFGRHFQLACGRRLLTLRDP